MAELVAQSELPEAQAALYRDASREIEASLNGSMSAAVASGAMGASGARIVNHRPWNQQMFIRRFAEVRAAAIAGNPQLGLPPCPACNIATCAAL